MGQGLLELSRMENSLILVPDDAVKWNWTRASKPSTSRIPQDVLIVMVYFEVSMWDSCHRFTGNVSNILCYVLLIASHCYSKCMEVEGCFLFCMTCFQYSIMMITCEQYIWNQSRKKLVNPLVDVTANSRTTKPVSLLISLYSGDLFSTLQMK